MSLLEEEQQQVNNFHNDFIQKLLNIEKYIKKSMVSNEENDVRGKEISLANIFEKPELLNRYRTEVSVKVKYCIRLRPVTEDEMEFFKYRTLAMAVDYINNLSLINLNDSMEQSTSLNNFGEALSVQDKIVLLRYGFAPLVLFDIAAGTISATKETQYLLCLATGITLHAKETIVPNSFLNQQIVRKCISLIQLLSDLKMDQEEEFILMKLIIVLGMDLVFGEDNEVTTTSFRSEDFSSLSPQLLSINGRHFVEKLRKFACVALYHHSLRKATEFLLMLLKLMLISNEFLEYIRTKADSLFYELFNQKNKEQNEENIDEIIEEIIGETMEDNIEEHMEGNIDDSPLNRLDSPSNRPTSDIAEQIKNYHGKNTDDFLKFLKK
uniref:NR LBD domain-containing protein n=1 Tax=Meloidogyne hapla TaxID=6305 RepID=A0A1I8BSS3_MELHA